MTKRKPSKFYTRFDPYADRRRVWESVPDGKDARRAAEYVERIQAQILAALGIPTALMAVPGVRLSGIEAIDRLRCRHLGEADGSDN
jgi:hypothetical protein